MLDWCLSDVMRVIEDLEGEAVILLVFSQSSREDIYCCASEEAVIIEGCDDSIVRSSAKVKTLVLGEEGRGRSEVNKLNNIGERIEPWGVPFGSLRVSDRVLLYNTFAVRAVRKLANHFFKLFGRVVLRILFVRRWEDTVSKALFMSMAIRMFL